MRNKHDRLSILLKLSQYLEQLVYLLRREHCRRLIKDDNVRASV